MWTAGCSGSCPPFKACESLSSWSDAASGPVAAEGARSLWLLLALSPAAARYSVRDPASAASASLPTISGSSLLKPGVCAASPLAGPSEAFISLLSALAAGSSTSPLHARRSEAAALGSRAAACARRSSLRCSLPPLAPCVLRCAPRCVVQLLHSSRVNKAEDCATNFSFVALKSEAGGFLTPAQIAGQDACAQGVWARRGGVHFAVSLGPTGAGRNPRAVWAAQADAGPAAMPQGACLSRPVLADFAALSRRRSLRCAPAGAPSPPASSVRRSRSRLFRRTRSTPLPGNSAYLRRRPSLQANTSWTTSASSCCTSTAMQVQAN